MTRGPDGWELADENRVGYLLNGGDRLTDPDD